MSVLVEGNGVPVFPVIDMWDIYPIQPRHIDIDRPLREIFKGTNLESQAFLLMRFFHAQGHWRNFTFEEFMKFGYSRVQREHPFVGTREHPLLLELPDRSYAPTHYFITTMFYMYPAKDCIAS